jgi:hypothetical protein
VIGGSARFVIAALMGWLAIARFGHGLDTLFVLVALGSIAFGGITATAMLLSPWRAPGERAELATAKDARAT